MVKSMDIREKSLNEIYGWEPVKPELDSYVLRTAARALRLPLKDLSPEEIRLLVSQKTGLAYILPLAVAILRKNPMTRTCYYEGDLLDACRRLKPSDWDADSTELRDFQDILKQAEPRTVTEFETPCGTLTLHDSDGTQLPFQVQQIMWDTAVSVYDDIVQKYIPLESPHQYTITVPAGGLTIGKDYILRLDGDCKYAYGDSDECAVANLVTGEKVTLSLGAQDLNDAEKDRQAVPLMRDGIRAGWQAPAQYDESKFREYVIFTLEDWSGYSFHLVDQTCPEIIFRLAWAEHNLPDVAASEYAAVTHWTIM